MDIFSIDPFDLLIKHENTIKKLLQANQSNTEYIRALTEQNVKLSQCLVDITKIHNQLVKRVHDLEKKI